MKKFALFLSIAVMSCLLISPVWAENSDTNDLQALKDQLTELNKLVQSQQKQIEQQDKKLLEQEYKIFDLEEMATEPTPYAEAEAKAEAAPPPDGLTVGKGKIRITPYGFIRLDMAYDDSAVVHSTGNIVAYVLSEDPSGAFPFAADDDDQSFITTATATRLGLNFDGPEFAGGNVRGKIEIDFDEAAGGDFGGDVTAHRIRMRHAYAELVYPDWSLLAGQTWDIITPRIPYMLDCMVMWGSGNVGYRRAQLRYTRTCEMDAAKITTQLSLNHGDRDVSTNGDGDIFLLDTVESGYPMLEGRVGLDTMCGDSKVSLGLSGMLGEQEVDSPVTGEKERLGTWLVGLDGQATVIPGLLMVQGEIWTGENLNSVYGGIMQNYVSDGGELEEVEASGGFIHAMLTPRKDLKFNCGYGIDDVDNDRLVARNMNYTIFGNVIYTVVPNFDVGLEVAWHETKWVGRENGDDLRIQTAFTYKF